MTVETLTTAELQDISALEFDCKGCGAKTVRKLDDKLKVPDSCNNCGAQWFSENGPDGGEMGFFIERIKYYGRDKFPFVFRLQLNQQVVPSTPTRDR